MFEVECTFYLNYLEVESQTNVYQRQTVEVNCELTIARETRSVFTVIKANSLRKLLRAQFKESNVKSFSTNGDNLIRF